MDRRHGAFDAVQTACGEARRDDDRHGRAEGHDASSRTRSVSPGAQISDTLKVSGLGQTPATSTSTLYGPYASRADIDCAGTPYWKGKVAVTGDGTFSTPKATVRRVGFYVFRERIAGSETVTATQGECVVGPRRRSAAPPILGGRGDKVAEVRGQGGGP